MRCLCFVFRPLQRKRLASNYLNTPLFLTARGRCPRTAAPQGCPGARGQGSVGDRSLQACVGTELLSGGWSFLAPGPSSPWPPLPRHLLWGGGGPAEPVPEPG